MKDKPYIQQSNPFKRESGNNQKMVRNVYWGEVKSIDDIYEGGRIKVKIPELDTNIPDVNLAYCYPLLPKYFHVYPKVGEAVRIIIEDINYPQRSRFWIGNIISQLQFIKKENITTALNTTNVGRSNPDKALKEYPEAKGVFPTVDEIAILGRNNTDLIFRDNEVELRAGKHELNNVFKLNKQNPASIKLSYDKITGNTNTTQTRSFNAIMGDIIALISHDGIPKFKAVNVDAKERERIIQQGHPIIRGDLLVQVLEVFRRALLEHVHPYPKLPSDKSKIMIDLEKLDLEILKQNNIIIN